MNLVAGEINNRCLKKLHSFANSFQFIFDKRQKRFLFLDDFSGGFVLNSMIKSNSLSFVIFVKKKKI